MHFEKNCAILYGLFKACYAFTSYLPFAVRELGGGRFIIMGVIETILIILEALCSIALIAVVLLQSG